MIPETPAGDTPSRRNSEELFASLYEELRRLATQQLRHEKPGQTLQATALVHEAWFRMGGDENPLWNSRGHFFAAAAEAMRRILVDNARRKKRQKHGGDLCRTSPEAVELFEDGRAEQVIAVSEALETLAETADQAAELVKLRYFGGLTLPEAAVCLDVSTRTADRLWAYAKAWLHRELQQ